MTSSSEAIGDTPALARTASGKHMQTFLWSVRREIWENRSLYIAPAIAAAFVLAGVLLAAFHSGHIVIHSRRPVEKLTPDAVLMIPHGIAIGAIVVTGILVGLFYCLGALNNERRDRSILFWKSLPVSNVTTVASKAFAAMAVLPVFVFATVVATQLIMLAVEAAALMAHGESVAPLGDLPFGRLWLGMAWGLFCTALWWAPIYGWLLMVSAWAKKMTFLWAVLPPIGLVVFERLAFNTDYFANVLRDRWNGSLSAAFKVPEAQLHQHLNVRQIIDLPSLDPVGFFTSPGLWIGLLVGAAFFAAAVWLRRRAEPV